MKINWITVSELRLTLIIKEKLDTMSDAEIESLLGRIHSIMRGGCK